MPRHGFARRFHCCVRVSLCRARTMSLCWRGWHHRTCPLFWQLFHTRVFTALRTAARTHALRFRGASFFRLVPPLGAMFRRCACAAQRSYAAHRLNIVTLFAATLPWQRIMASANGK